MHPLSLFPQLLSYGLIAPTLLRLSVGIIGIIAGRSRFNKPYKWASIFYLAVSVLLILGLYTQAAALAGLIIVAFDYFADRKVAPMTGEKRILYSIVKIILITLLFSGPGFFAFDLPL